MFKIEKTGKNTFKYLTDCEKKHIGYQKYLDVDTKHFKAVLTGGLADDMGIEYSTETLRSLMLGELPEGAKNNNYDLKKGNNLIKVGKNHQVGTDLLSAPPKSVSMEFALSDYEGKKKIVEAMRETDLEIQKFLAENVRPSCQKGEYQDFDPSKTKIMVATFTHYEDRQIDPHIHNHGILMNFAEFTFNRVNEKGEMIEVKKILALDTKEIFKTQLEMSAIYDTILNSKLQEKGYKTEPAVTAEGFETFRLKGYTEKQEKMVSKRGEEIKEFIEEQKKKGKHYADLTLAEAEYNEMAQRQTREVKKDLTTEEIWETIEKETEKVMPKQEKDYKNEMQKNSESDKKEFSHVEFLEKNIFNTNTFVSETELRKELVVALRFSAHYPNFECLVKEVDKRIEELKDVSINGKNSIVYVDGAFTKLSTYENEKKSLDNLILLSQRKKNEEQAKEEETRNLVLFEKFKENFNKKFELNDGQEDACKLVAKSNDLTIVVGDAGTGKTTSVIKFAAEMHSANGAKVFGLSTQTTTADALAEAGISKENCLNTKKFLRQCYDKTGKRFDSDFIRDNKNSVIIIDEAGMIGAEDYKKITDVAIATNSKLIIVGDQKQLSAVSYGNTFEQIQERIEGDLISRLSINTRQKEGSFKVIAEAYRDKDIDKVFSILEQENCLNVGNTQKETIDKMVEDYLNDKNKSKIIICGTNDEIDLVNNICRTKIISEEIKKFEADKKYKSEYDFKNQHEITITRPNGKGVKKLDLQFCKGDEIVFLKNKKGVANNGEIGKITSIKKTKNGLEISANITDDGKTREVKFNTNDYTSFNHSFALSSHKSQGKTYENVYHLGSEVTNANKSYVDGSRHKNQYKLYIESKSVEAFKKNAIKSVKRLTTIGNKTVEYAYAAYRKVCKTSPISPDHMYENLARENSKKANENIISKKEYDEIMRIDLVADNTNKPKLQRGLAVMEGSSPELQQKNLENVMAMNKDKKMLEAINAELQRKKKAEEEQRILDARKAEEEEYQRNQRNAMQLNKYSKPTPYDYSPSRTGGRSM